MSRKHICASCGAEFPNLAQLVKHKAECPATVSDDDPSDSDDAAEGTPAKRLPPLGDSDGGKPGPAVLQPNPKPAKRDEVVIPWSLLDPVFKVLGGSTPVRFEGIGYISDAGLLVSEVKVARRR